MEKFSLYYQDKKARLRDGKFYGTKKYPVSVLFERDFYVEHDSVIINIFYPRLLRFGSLKNLRFYLFDNSSNEGEFVSPTYSDFVKQELEYGKKERHE